MPIRNDGPSAAEREVGDFISGAMIDATKRCAEWMRARGLSEGQIFGLMYSSHKTYSELYRVAYGADPDFKDIADITDSRVDIEVTLAQAIDRFGTDKKGGST